MINNLLHLPGDGEISFESWLNTDLIIEISVLEGKRHCAKPIEAVAIRMMNGSMMEFSGEDAKTILMYARHNEIEMEFV